MERESDPSRKSDNASSIAIDVITAQFRKEPPQNSSDKSRRGGTSWVNPRKHREGAMRSDATKHDFRDLKRGGDTSLASRDKKDQLQVVHDPGGASQHRKVGYVPMVDARPIPWTPREVANAILMKGECKTRQERIPANTPIWTCSAGGDVLDMGVGWNVYRCMLVIVLGVKVSK